MSPKYICLILAIFTSNTSAHFGVPHALANGIHELFGGSSNSGDDTPGDLCDDENQDVESGDEEIVIIQDEQTPQVQSVFQQITRKPLLLKGLGSSRIREPNVAFYHASGLYKDQRRIYPRFRSFDGLSSGYASAGGFYSGYTGLLPYEFNQKETPLFNGELITINIPEDINEDKRNRKETQRQYKVSTLDNCFVQDQQIRRLKKKLIKLVQQLQEQKEQLQKEKEKLQKQKQEEKEKLQKEKEKLQKQKQEEKEKLQKQKEKLQKQKQEEKEKLQKQEEKLQKQKQEEKEKLQKQEEKLQKQKQEEKEKLQKQEEKLQKQKQEEKEKLQKEEFTIQKQREKLEKERELQKQQHEQSTQNKREQPDFIKPKKVSTIITNLENSKKVEENEENSQVNYTHERKHLGDGKSSEFEHLSKDQNEKSMNIEEFNKHQMHVKKQVF